METKKLIHNYQASYQEEDAIGFWGNDRQGFGGHGTVVTWSA